MFSVKVKRDGKWVKEFESTERDEILDYYNRAAVPRMLLLNKRVVHKQYSDNSFIYVGK